MAMCTLLVVIVMFMVSGSSLTLGASVSRQLLLEVLNAFEQGISSNSRDALASWDTLNQSSNPCSGTWAGLQCDFSTANDNTTIIITNIDIDLKNKSLQGSITPQLAHLSGALTSLDLSYNSLSGTITFLSNFSSSDNSLQTVTLDYNHLQGRFTLPPSCLPRLTSLSIAMNSFTGPLPSEALSHCPSLQFLNVSNNQFTGSLFPAGLGNLTITIGALDAGINNLSGPIPPSVGNCSILTFLSLPFNNFSGPMPSSFGLSCPNLEFLSLFGNYGLSGSLPQEIGLLSKLSYFSIGLNNFSGEILQILVNCSALTTVDTSQMSFSGTMPVDIGSRLTNLRFLNMEFNTLTGSIPESLGNCSHLDYLLLGFNYNLSGAIPPALFRAQHISQLDLQFNSLSGNIPLEIKNLSSLQKTYLNNNKFTGSLPEELAMLVSLQVLTLEHNSLTGNFPNQLFNCTTLMGLSLHDNSFAGPISSSIGRLFNLENFEASSNKLTGQLPLELSNCTSLETLSLSNNMLSGEIPPTVISDLLKCLSFDVSHNNLSGPIPDAEFQEQVYLQILDLSHNELSGSIPSGLADCVDLGFLNLSQNKLTGPLPSALGESLLNLVKLNLSHNSINGSIPTELSGLKSLQQLDLSSNALSGTIPSALAQMQNLQFLNLSYNNQLEGLIPTGGVFENLTSTSFLGDHMLCSAVINTTCIKSDQKSALKLRVIGFAVAASLLLIIIIILGFLVLIALRRQITRRRLASDWEFNPYLKLKLEDVQQATGNFSEDNILGAGVTGTVYKGVLNDGKTLAFKKFKLDDSSLQSFVRELKSMGYTRHRNLARIMGYCYNPLGTFILVLEYMSNGSLENHLHERKQEPLSWDARLRVALSVAEGLLYLHNDCPSPVIHCDLKPQNILFDANMEVRITDFGLAKVMVSTRTSSFTNNMQGTLGYMAPELASYGHISRKCDVYSYGVLLMELITGRRPFEEVQMMQLDRGEHAQSTMTLIQWVASMFEANEIRGILDEALQARCDTSKEDEIDQMKKFLDLALQCTREDPRQRPTMQDAVQTLFSITSNDHLPVKSQIFQEILSSNEKFVVKNPQKHSFSLVGP